MTEWAHAQPLRRAKRRWVVAASAASATLLFLLWGAQAQAQTQTRLAWRLEVGTVQRYRVELAQTTTQRSGGYAFETSQRLGLVWTLSVEETYDDGSASVRLRYDEVRVDLNLMSTGRLTWDSSVAEDRKRDKDPSVAPYVALVGKSIRFRMRPDGRVVRGSIAGLEGIRQAILEAAGGGPWAQATILPTFADEFVRAQLESCFATLPDKPVVPGMSWEHEIVQPLPVLGGLAFTKRFRLLRFEPLAREGRETNRRAVIESTTTITRAPDVKPPAIGALEAASNVDFESGSGEGMLWFLVEQGALERTEQTLRLQLSARVSREIMERQSPKDTTVKLEIVQRIRVERLGQ